MGRAARDGLQAAGQLLLFHFCATGFQGLDRGSGKALGFQQGGSIQAAEVGQIDGLLGCQPPAQHALQGFGGVVNDLRPAGAACAHHQLAGGFVKHQRGRHGRAGAFARLNPVGNGLAVSRFWGHAEVGQLVVEQKAFDHLAAAKLVFDGGGHGQCVAVGIHNADVAGAVFDLLGHGGVANPVGRRVACLRHLHALLANQLRARLQVAVVQQVQPVAAGGLHKVGVGHVQCAVGKGQARGFGVEVQPIGSGQAIAAQRHGGGGRVVQDAQDLPHGNRPRAGGREPANLIAARAHALGVGRQTPVMAQGCTLFGLVAGQVLHRQHAGVGGVAAHLVHNGLGHRAFVQRFAAVFGNGAQHLGVFGVFQQGTHGQRFTVGAIEVGARYRVCG